MDGGDGSVVVAQQDQLASPGLNPDSASNDGPEPSKNLHGRQVVSEDSDTLKVTPPDRRGAFEQLLPNRFDGNGIRRQHGDLDPAAALVRVVFDNGLARRCHGQRCRSLRGRGGDLALDR